MRISRLRLLGFKSFVEPTELLIEPGLTGVVGPNGCGKSNLLEAIRWVMGETSYKSMRASAMDDVIFSGTNARPSRNMAEVTIFLDNTERKAPAEYNDTDEIEITRRIEREAGSAYRINGREARARDIKILFEDAATGARSPSLVRQGQIGDIVNAKPEARRRILEDAAGIAGLHSRRHDAELRLRAAETNLTRLDDVLGGLNAQIESLKRQARQARRYKDVSEEIRRAHALQLHLSWTEARALLESEEHKLREILSALGDATTGESKSLRREAELAEQIPPLRETEADKSAIFGRLKVESENFEREVQRTTARVDELKNRADQIERDIAREQNFQREATEIIARLEQEISNLTAAESEAESSSQLADTDLVSAQSELTGAEADLTDLTRKFANEQARRTAVDSAITDSQSMIARLEQQITALTTQSDDIASGAPDTEKLKQTTERGKELAAEITQIEQQTQETDEKVRLCTGELKSVRETALEAQRQADRISTERETLTRLLIPDETQTYPPILESVSVTPGYEAALGAALGDDLDASTDDNSAIHWSLIEGQSPTAPLPDGIESLAQYVKAPPQLARRLEHIGVVSPSDGPRLQKQLLPGQRLVTPEGDLWRWDGFVAASHGTTSAAQRLAHRNQLSEFLEQEQDLKAKAEACHAHEQQALAKLTEAEQRQQTLRQSWRDLNAELTRTREDLTTIERQARETESKLAALKGAKARAEQDLTEAHEKFEQLKNEREIFAAEASNTVEASLTDMTATVQQLRTAVAEKSANKATLKREQELRTSRLAAQRKDLQGWQSRKKDASEHTEALKTRLSETQQELETYADLPQKLEHRRQELFNALKEAEQNCKEAADALSVADTNQKEAAKQLRSAQAKVSEIREERARIDTRIEALHQRLEEEQARIQEAFNEKPENCLGLAQLPEGADLPSLEDVNAQVAKLKSDRERLGGVNLQADDELTQLNDQLATINAERSDVEEAVAKLRNAIAQLNREGRKRLGEAFEKVDAHFRKLFTTLFGGGEARLEMIESEEDPLEGGLEIIARPPGKKPATLSLLSGGEQSLTAQALIFAVFLTNPAPICVLDEVDAPLDDANVDRFCTLMEQMAKDTATRFLVITHHPMTMARMNRLFGVTMAEKGVSQLVSVDLETARSFREAG